MTETITCGLLIKQINDALEKRANNMLRPARLTVTQLGALLALDRAPNGNLTMKNMERELHVAQSTTVGIMSRLEQKGFVESFGDTADRRVKRVRITEEGAQMCAMARENMAAEDRFLMSIFSPEEQEEFLAQLQKLQKHLN